MTRTSLQIAAERAKQVEVSTDQRNFWICRAHAEGATLRMIASSVGMSVEGVRKIINRA